LGSPALGAEKTIFFKKIWYNIFNMEEKNRIKISLITGNKPLQEAVVSLLPQEDYEIKILVSQEEAISASEKDPPELILAELLSPNLNGLELSRELRKNFLFRYIPIIMLLPDGESQDKESLIYSGCDDYLQKSRLNQELFVKVKLNLTRIARQQDINPLTRLPGQASLLKELQKRIASKSMFALHYADLAKIKDFNQRYGFKKGDEVIKYTGTLIFKALQKFGSPSDLLCHPQNDDFIFITLPDSIDAVAGWITKEFDKNIRSFYDDEDAKRGYLLLKNRKGEIQKIPLLRIYISVVTNECFPYSNVGQIIQVASELRSFAQNNFPNSFYVKDRRKSYTFR
jgi:CheY-like chemotaxis protein